MNIRRTPSLILVLFVCAGCAPSIDSVTVTPGGDVNVVNIEAVIRDAAAITLQTPTVSIAPLPAATPFTDVGNMSNVSGSSRYRRDNLISAGGQFRARVTVPYTVLFLPGTRTKSHEVDFSVDVPAGCFFFDQGSADWTVNGFFAINSSGPQDPGTRVNICAGQFPFVTRGINSRSLAVLLGAQCFSNPQPPPTNNFVAFDFVSPPLAGVSGWENANGFELHATALSANISPQNPVRLQLIFTDSTGQARPQLSAGDNFVLHNLSGQSQTFAMNRPGFTVSSVRARIFVPGGVTYGPEEMIAIDRVCPRS